MAVDVLYQRTLEISYSTELINVIVGARRTGKSYFIRGETAKLKAGDFLYLDLEDEKYSDLDAVTLGKYLDENLKGQHYIFIDEIQAVLHWEKVIRRLYETKKYFITLTGSSSKMLTEDISTTLRGRSINHRINPFNYHEISSQNIFSFDTYWKDGGLIQLQDIRNKNQYIQDYKKQIVYKDVIERFNLKYVDLLEYMIQYLCESASSRVSFRNIKLRFDAAGYRVSLETVIEYVRYLVDACFIREVSLFTRSASKRLVNNKKFYVLDHKFVLNGKGPTFETMVFNNLASYGFDIGHSLGDYEVDFVISEGNNAIPVQACYRLNSKSQRSATYEREVSTLLKFFDDHFYLKNKVGYIVTLDEDFVENFGDIEIRAISFTNFFESKELPIFS